MSAPLESVTCKVCGHTNSQHNYGPPIFCALCPDSVCQNGPAGKAYRALLHVYAPTRQHARIALDPAEQETAALLFGCVTPAAAVKELERLLDRYQVGPAIAAGILGDFEGWATRGQGL